MRRSDLPALLRLKSELVEGLGEYAGAPDRRPDYGAPIDPSEPELEALERIWRSDLAAAARSLVAARRPARPRVLARQARACFQSVEAETPESSDLGQLGQRLLVRLIGQQSSRGVFGFPYDPKDGSRLGLQARKVVEAARERGLVALEGPYLVDDLGDGGLNFDNGEAGLALFYAYWVSGEAAYRSSALRAADWVLESRRTVRSLNFNYNSFSGQLLARAYRETGDASYLQEARDLFDHAILVGQMEDGRWFDQHNARASYHAILLRSMIEYFLALRQAGEEGRAQDVADRARLGLDNLARQICDHGAVNAHELLPVEALCWGMWAFGERETWARACHISVNYTTQRLRKSLSRRGMPLPEAIGTYVLWRQGRVSGRTGAAISSGLSIDSP